MSEKSKKNQSVIKSAAFMSLGTFGSRILGFVRDRVIATEFDNTIKDAFVVAFKLPNQFRRLFGEGALAVSFIPIFIEQLQPRDNISPEEAEKQASDLKNAVFTIVSGVAGLITALGVVFMEPLLGWLVSGDGFMSVPGKFELAVNMARWMFFYLFLVINFAFCSSVLNALNRFFVPAIAPAIFNAFFIMVSLLPQSMVSYQGQQLAYAVLVGGVVQVLAVMWPLYKMGHLPKFYWNPQMKNVGKVFKNMVPGLIGAGVLQLMSIANLYFASQLPEGTLSYIYFADRILELPQSLLAISMSTALLPTLSAAWANNEKDKMKAEGQKQIGTLLFLALPAATGMYLLAQPIVEVLFMDNKFTQQDAIATGRIVQIYAFLFLIMAIHKVTVPNFYAMKNTWVPAVTSTVALLVHVSFALVWMKHYGLDGLIYSMIFAAGANFCVLMAFYHKFLGAFPYMQFVKNVARHIPSVVGLGATVILLESSLKPYFMSSLKMSQGLAGVLALFSNIFVAAGVYFAVGTALKVPECQWFLGVVKRRLGKKT